MRFLDPDAGEMLDRLSVLARKRLEKPEREHFEKEEQALLAHWGKRSDVFNAELLPKVLRLAAVNMAIWECESAIRSLRYELRLIQETDVPPPAERDQLEALGEQAITLQSRNEERARLVQFFNEKIGYGAVEEKDFQL